MNIDEIQKQFPAPVRSSGVGNQSPERYCIGGAFVLHQSGITLSDASAPDRFPPPEDLAQTLSVANPALTLPAAGEYAMDIAFFNDMGCFEEAWNKLGHALTHQ